MSQLAKLIAKIRNNPNDVRFDDAQKVAEFLGFAQRKRKGGAGTSHHIFSRPGEATILNFQPHNGKIRRYQAEELIAMIDKYENEHDEGR
jgi:hypothetical protein